MPEKEGGRVSMLIMEHHNCRVGGMKSGLDGSTEWRGHGGLKPSDIA